VAATSWREVTLIWPEPAGGAYSLLVDGDAAVDGTDVVVTPVKAVLHRVAVVTDSEPDGPSCITVLPTT